MTNVYFHYNASILQSFCRAIVFPFLTQSRHEHWSSVMLAQDRLAISDLDKYFCTMLSLINFCNVKIYGWSTFEFKSCIGNCSDLNPFYFLFERRDLVDIGSSRYAVDTYIYNICMWVHTMLLKRLRIIFS